MAFVDLEINFDRVPRKVLWWALRVDGVPEWLLKVVQAMYVGVRSKTHVNSSFSKEFEVKVGVHQGSVLYLLLFIIVLEALSHEFCVGDDEYADDIVILAETFEGLHSVLPPGIRGNDFCVISLAGGATATLQAPGWGHIQKMILGSQAGGGKRFIMTNCWYFHKMLQLEFYKFRLRHYLIFF